MFHEQPRALLLQTDDGEESSRVQECRRILAHSVGIEVPVVHHPVRDYSPIFAVAVAAQSSGDRGGDPARRGHTGHNNKSSTGIATEHIKMNTAWSSCCRK